MVYANNQVCTGAQVDQFPSFQEVNLLVTKGIVCNHTLVVMLDKSLANLYLFIKIIILALYDQTVCTRGDQ